MPAPDHGSGAVPRGQRATDGAPSSTEFEERSTRAHWPESPPNLSCLEPTGTGSAEYGQLSPKQQAAGSSPARGTGSPIVVGKARRPRAAPFGRKTALALDRHRRMRASHPFAHLPNLWLGVAGAMTPSGLYQGVAAPGGAAGR